MSTFFFIFLNVTEFDCECLNVEKSGHGEQSIPIFFYFKIVFTQQQHLYILPLIDICTILLLLLLLLLQ